VRVAYESLDAGIDMARAGKHISDISFAVQSVVEKHGFGVIRDFAGHGMARRCMRILRFLIMENQAKVP